MVQLSGSETGNKASDGMVEPLLLPTDILECHRFGVVTDMFVRTSSHHTL